MFKYIDIKQFFSIFRLLHKQKIIFYACLFFSSFDLLWIFFFTSFSSILLDLNIKNETNELSLIFNKTIIMLIIGISEIFLNLIKNLLKYKLISNILCDVRSLLFNKVLTLSELQIDNIGSAELFNRFMDIEEFSNIINIILNIFLIPVNILCLLIVSFKKNINLTYLLIFSILIYLILIFFINYVVSPKFEILRDIINKININIRLRIKNVIIIKTFVSEIFEEEKFNKLNKKFKKVNFLLNKRISQISLISIFISNAVIILIMLFGAHDIKTNGGFLVLDLIIFLQYFSILNDFFSSIFLNLAFISKANISIKRVFEILNIKTNEKKEFEINSINKIKKISFNDISSNFIDKTINFEIDIEKKHDFSNKFVISGQAGSGKSLIMKFLLNIYDDYKGVIKINDLDIRKINFKCIYSLIGFATQNSNFISDATIRENLTFANNFVIDDIKFINALRIAELHEFANEKNLNYVLKNNANNLSGGQKQRLTLARVLLLDFQIIILDDIFSGIDYNTKMKILKNIESNLSNKFIIVITNDGDIKTFKNHLFRT